jgi:type IV pilus assembly protein PilA
MFKAFKKKMKDQRGLTLIELLAVVVILGIIAAIAVPSIGNIIENTRNKATVAEGIQIINAAKIYKAQNTTATTITHTQLESFVDNVKDTDGFTVNYDAATGIYSITGHPSVPLANTTASATTATEAQLLAY